MRALCIDFAPPSPWPARALYAAASCLLLVALWQGRTAWRGDRRLAEEKAGATTIVTQWDAVRAGLAHPAVRSSGPGYVHDAQAIARAAAFDVGGVLRAIESAQIVGAKVESLDIEAQERSADLIVDVTGPEVAIAYVQALDAGEARPSWRLVRLQTQAGKSRAEIRGAFP